MTTWLPRWFACLVLVLPFVPAVADGPDGQEIARLVKQLDSARYKEREAATKRLKEIGEPALAALGKATAGSTLEVRRRAERIITAIEDKLCREPLVIPHAAEILCVSADGKRLLTVGGDCKTLRLWDADTGKCVRVFGRHTTGISSAALAPDGRRVLSGSHDKTVRLWDAMTGKELRKMTGHTQYPNSVAFGPEGQALSTGDGGAVFVWDLSTGKQAGALTADKEGLYNVAYSDQAKLAATCSHDYSVRLWNLETGKVVRKLDTDVQGVCFSVDGKHLFSSHYLYYNAVRCWDVGTGNERQKIPAANTSRCAFSPDGKRLVTFGHTDNAVRVWDASTGTELRRYEGHTAAVRSVAFLPDGKRIASTSCDGTVRIWRAPR